MASYFLIPLFCLLISGLAHSNTTPSAPIETSNEILRLEVYVRDGCYHCSKAKDWLHQWEPRNPRVSVEIKNISENEQHAFDFQSVVERLQIDVPAVPLFVAGPHHTVGFHEERTPDIIQHFFTSSSEFTALQRWEWLTVSKLGLPLFTIVLGLIDGFNPCAMWVLLFLLSLLVHVKSRRRMFAIAGVFVLTSGVVYFIFMAAWLSFFSALGVSPWIRGLVGIAGLTMAFLNLKDFFFGFSSTSLILSDSAKSRLAQKVRAVVTAENLPLALASVALLALLVNLYELLCTAGLPALYTQILAQQDLSRLQYLGYLALYNLAYIFDDSLMVFISVWALSVGRLTETGGRYLKLLSGGILLLLSLLIIFKPEWLSF